MFLTQPPVMYPPSLLFSLFLLLLHRALFSTAILHKSSLIGADALSQRTTLKDTPPTLFFEVIKPIQLPNTTPCSYFILQHDFGFTYGKSPVLANYTPPSECPSRKFSKIVLEWNSTCKGRQFDRIFGIWLGGVELLRSCTAEPRATGIAWSVEKDITRSISSSGWVRSSHGNLTTNSIQNLRFSNSMVVGSNGTLQVVNQTIHFNDSVHAKMPSSSVYSAESHKEFSLYLYYNYLDQGNETSFSLENITLGFNEKKSEASALELSKSSLQNVQNGQGYMTVKDNLVVSGLGSTQQVYKYDDSNSCYFRNVSSSNYTILYDKVGNTYNGRTQSHLDL